jgi:hypothetical protein
MELNELKAKEQEIHNLVEKLTDEDNERYPIYDGINDLEQYLKAKYKIMFILKEPYDGTGGTGGDWAIKDILGKGGYGRASRTFYPLIYISYGILNDFCAWDDMDNVQDNFDEMNSYLYKVAHINISKLPSLNTTRTNFSDIVNAYNKDKENDCIILKQIDAYQPDIIIGCGIGNLLADDLELYQPENKTGYRSKKYPNLLYIGTGHPALRTETREVYVDYVITVAKELLSKE